MREALFVILILAIGVISIDDTSSDNTVVHRWDNKYINILGSGWDILDNEPRESFFVLESEERSDPDKEVLTKTLPKDVIMRSKKKETFHRYAEVISKNQNIKDSRDISVSGGGSYSMIKGSFSDVSKVIQSFISKISHKVTRVNAYVTLDEFDLQTWNLSLTSGVHDRIYKVGNLLSKVFRIEIDSNVFQSL